jgi:pimeloyl-ACP methyl ester carboxylesterase
MHFHVDLHGPSGTTPLVLIHGFLSSRAQWIPNLPALAGARRIASVELLGHGRSPSPDDPSAYRVAAYVDALDQLRERLGAERIDLCGQSFGAGIALRYALAHPARVRGVVITNSVSALSPPDLVGPPEERARQADAIEDGGAAAIAALPYHPRNATRVAAEVRAALEADAALLNPRGVANLLRVTAPEVSVDGRLGALKAPLLLVNGLWEKTFQPLRTALATTVPGCRIVDLAGGHSINLEAPEAFDRAVLDFLAELDRA